MRKLTLLFALFVVAISATSFVTPAFAQATRTWVSGVGDDVNPCSRTAPCKTFPGAISKTAAGGEINCLDPGGFGGVTITKSISIICQVEAGVLVSGTNGITVSNPTVGTTIKVLLRGLDIEGLRNTAQAPGLNGVQIIGTGAASVIIQDCSIRNFSQNGVNVAGPAGTRAAIINSTIIGNAGGVNVQGAAGAANSGVIMSSLLDSNTSFAVQANGASQALSIIRSNLLASPTGISALGGAAVASFGPSNVITGAGAPTVSPVFQ